MIPVSADSRSVAIPFRDIFSLAFVKMFIPKKYERTNKMKARCIDVLEDKREEEKIKGVDYYPSCLYEIAMDCNILPYATKKVGVCGCGWG
jgi:hypothetical protein